MEKQYLVKLDVYLGVLETKVINFNQLNTGTCKICFELTSNKQALDLTDKKVTFEVSTPSGSIIEDAILVTDAAQGKAECILANDMITEEGIHHAEINVYSKDGSKLLAFNKFRYIVNGQLGEKNVTVDTRYTTLQELIIEVNKLIDEVNDMEQGAQGPAGEDGREIELRKSPTHIQWRYVNDTYWNDLISIDALKGSDGAPGVNGKNIELQQSPTHIQWRVVDTETWNNLVSLADLRGPQGPKGDSPDLSMFYTKEQTYSKSEVDEKITNVSTGGNVDLTNYYNKQQVDQKISGIELTPGPTGPQGPVGPAGATGADGKSVEIQKNQTHIQWKNTGDTLWKDLISIDSLKGASGSDGKEIELRKSDTHIQYKYVGEGEQSWQNVVALQDIKGATGERGLQGVAGVNGKNIELQKSSTHIQWRVAGEGSWNDLVALSDLKGDPGESSSGSTVEKESIVLTPKTGFTIIDQDTFKVGNILYINAEIKKTDNGYLNQGNYLDVLECPLTMKKTALSAIGSNVGWFKIPCSGYANENSIATVPTKDCTTIRISGTVVL